MKRVFASIVIATAMVAMPVATAQSVPDFGSDSGNYTNDGECDDPRFAGDGMTGTLLLDKDVRADATDCKKAWNAGTIHLVNASASTLEPDFGDNSSMFSNDGECDDPRFSGDGMTNTTLIEEDTMADATDCREAWDAGQLKWVVAPVNDTIRFDGVDFGNNDSNYANDDECDDSRFVGNGMTNTLLLASDRLKDANDCVAAYIDGSIRLK